MRDGRAKNLKMSRIAERHQDKGSSSAATWARLRALAGECSINLGQGFPDFTPIPSALSAAQAALGEPSNNQYSPMGGIDSLKSALAGFYFREDGLPPTYQISVTTSGTEAVFASMQALVNPGDRVLLFEPCFPWYASSIKLAGGIPVAVELHAPAFSLVDPRTLESIAAALDVDDQEIPRVVIVCNPGNPTGRVLSTEESQLVAKIAVEHDMVLVSDEVYEAVIFPPPSQGSRLNAKALCILDRLEVRKGLSFTDHVPLRTLDGLSDRTLTIGSSSKLLSLTGWRVGWVVGPEDIVTAVRSSCGYSTYCAPTPLQHACAEVIASSNATGDRTFGGVGALFADNWLRLAVALEECIPGALVTRSEGGYFLCVDISRVSDGMDDLEFVQRLVARCGIAALPLRLFYNDASRPRKLVRFAVCKKRETIDQAVAALSRWL